ncbi:hypothetical protein CANINC_003478 [Pichia inconspicua]|uniref:Uncharacterized protein n=1 Tax=Pichia inconspicua TaxID=52247 RepID=A0A4T0WYM9_9ASCO|nr:hypothetical protein CANINC_003478 [[Candida] inconspicua]
MSGHTSADATDAKLAAADLDNTDQSKNNNFNNKKNSSHSNHNLKNSSVSSDSIKPFNNTANMMKEPKTPSLNKSTPTFASPAPNGNLPETPERIPRRIDTDLESTPLLSPGPSGNIFATPGRRRGSLANNAPDFYTLLKSPEVRMDDKGIKRTSLDLFSNSDTSPQKISKEYDSEHLLKSPRRDVKEIKKISENLKTRLNYANFKVQHGLSRKSIDELEQSLDSIATNTSTLKPEPKNLDDFWNLKADNLPGNANSSGRSLLASPSRFPISGRRRTSFNASVNLDDIAKRGVKASPDLTNSEFSNIKPVPLTQTSSLASLHVQSNLQSSPLQRANSRSKGTLSVDTKTDATETKLEQDAIYSLISMSSPTKYTAASSVSPSPPKQFASSINSNLKLPPPTSSTGNVTLPPLSAPGVLGGSSTHENPMRNYVFPPPSQGLGMFTSSNPIATNTIDSKMDLKGKVDEDLTEDETTEEEVFVDESNDANSIHETNEPGHSGDHKFRTFKYDNRLKKSTTERRDETK